MAKLTYTDLTPTGLTPTGGPFLTVADNLSDLSNATTARTNLGVAIGSDVQAYDATLQALSGYNTNGILTQTASDTFTGRTLTGTANQVTVTNGDGVSGNPTFSLPQSIATTSTVQFQKLGIGSAVSASAALGVGGSGNTTGASQFAMGMESFCDSTATSNNFSWYSRPRFGSGTYTSVTSGSLYLDNPPTMPAGVVTTNSCHIQLQDLTRGTNNYGVISNISAGATKFGWYGVGTANNLTNGAWIFGQMASEPTPGSNQAGIYAFDVSGTAELKAVDEAGNRVQLTPHPAEIMDAHASLMQSVGLQPVDVPWGYDCDQLVKGVNTKADIAAAIRCVEYLMAQAGKPVTLITETQITPEISWEDRQATEQQKYNDELASFKAVLNSMAQKPARLIGGNEPPKFEKAQPAIKQKPSWMGV